LVVALAGGVAWADSQSVAVPPGQGATVVAVMVPGPGGGGQVCSDGPIKGEDHIRFNIGGQIEVNGELTVPYVPAEEYTITLVFRLEMGAWVMDTTIENDAGVVCIQMGHPVDMLPSLISAAGEEVISLTASE